MIPKKFEDSFKNVIKNSNIKKTQRAPVDNKQIIASENWPRLTAWTKTLF